MHEETGLTRTNPLLEENKAQTSRCAQVLAIGLRIDINCEGCGRLRQRNGGRGACDLSTHVSELGSKQRYLMRMRCVQDKKMGHRSPLRQHSGMDSDGGVGRGYPKKQGGGRGFRLVDSASMLFFLLSQPPFFFLSLFPFLALSLALALARALSRISHAIVQYFLLSPHVYSLYPVVWCAMKKRMGEDECNIVMGFDARGLGSYTTMRCHLWPWLFLR